jgi:hypothetical protein
MLGIGLEKSLLKMLRVRVEKLAVSRIDRRFFLASKPVPG